MKGRRATDGQGGFALWFVLVALVVTGSYAYFRSANAMFRRGQQETALAATMLRAKEALLARAIIDDNRPGSLPCPDLISNLGASNVPGDGRADLFAGNHCPSYVGWFPWQTLDLPELLDDSGSRLWYALAPELRDDDSAQPINSDTALTLQVDGQSDIAAIIIAPGAPFAGQKRPSNRPVDYLEGGNGQSSQYFSGPPSSGFNDRLLVITRQEVMAAVGKRLAGEIRSCLEQHALSSANDAHRYPWPAPLAAENFHGKAGSHFGRLPQSQPSSGPSATLAASLGRLDEAKTQLAQNQDLEQQLATIKALNEAAIQARNLFDSIFLSANQLKQATSTAQNQLQAFSTSVSEAIANGRISRTEGSEIRTQGDNSKASLAQLPELLGELGIDVFPWQLARLSADLATAETPDKLVDRSLALQRLLLATSTPRTDLAQPLADSRHLASNAYLAALAAAAQADDITRLDAAKSAATLLLSAAETLRGAVAASRVNTLSSEIENSIFLLQNLDSALQDTGQGETLAALSTGLKAASTMVASISSGVSPVLNSQANAAGALTTASTSAAAALPNYARIEADTGRAIAEMRTLQNAIAANEASDNNLTRTSLSADLAALATAQMNFAQADTASPRPKQSDIVPYVVALGGAADNINLWLDAIAANAENLAPLARAYPLDAGKSPADATVLEDSAAFAANQLTSGIVGSNGALELLAATIAQPDANHQARLVKALAETGEQLGTLIDRARRVNNDLSGIQASAQPMIWNSSRCDFLRPGQHSWWNDNQWAPLLFYQIGNPLHAAPARLKVDQRGAYRLVTLAAGPAIEGQNRRIAKVANFLEGTNADPSRDGDASTPIDAFSALPPGHNFNDRLAY